MCNCNKFVFQSYLHKSTFDSPYDACGNFMADITHTPRGTTKINLTNVIVLKTMDVHCKQTRRAGILGSPTTYVTCII